MVYSFVLGKNKGKYLKINIKIELVKVRSYLLLGLIKYKKV